jgi:hypothetical protein
MSITRIAKSLFIASAIGLALATLCAGPGANDVIFRLGMILCFVSLPGVLLNCGAYHRTRARRDLVMALGCVAIMAILADTGVEFSLRSRDDFATIQARCECRRQA